MAWGNPLKAPNTLIDQRLHQRLIGHSTTLGSVLRTAEKLFRDSKRNLCRRLIKRLEYLAFELFIAQLVERVVEWLPCRFGLHLLILRMILLDAARA